MNRKGIRELEVKATGENTLLPGKIRAFEVHIDEVDTYEKFVAGSLGGNPDVPAGEESYLDMLRQVSRRIKPSSPGGASSGT